MTRDIEFIVNCLRNTVRYPQIEDPGLGKLPDSLVEPATARLIYHPLLTTDNLQAIAPDFNSFTYPAWDNATTYEEGDKVDYTGTLYKSLTDGNLNNQPDVSPSEWELLDEYADWLEDQREEGIRTFASNVFNLKKDERETKTLLDSLVLHDRIARINDTIVKQDRVVGLEIELINHNNINVLLERISTQFTDLQAPLTFRLHHSSQVDPIATFDITTTKQRSVEWHSLTQDNNLQYRDFSNDLQGGLYYLTYREDELNGQALNARYNYGRVPCGSCSRYNSNAYKKWSQFVNIRAISVGDGKYDDTAANTLWDLNDIQYNTDQSWGINLTISAYCELKQFMCEQSDIWGEGIAQQITVDMLRQIANTIRSNVLSEKTRELAIRSIANEDLGGENEMKKLETVTNAANFEISDIQKSACMPCLPRKGPVMRSVNTSIRTGYYGHNIY